jgi:peroxin-6
MDRVVAQLLVELDGVSSSQSKDGARSDVFVIGATNRPDLLDSSLLRPGRFDRLLYLGSSQNRATQISILRAITRKFTLAPDVVLDDILDFIPPTFTGADISAVASQALMRALKRRIGELEEELRAINRSLQSPDGRDISMTAYLSQLSEEELQARVTREDFIDAAKSVTPSVSQEELRHYERLREQFSSHMVPDLKAASTERPMPLVMNGSAEGKAAYELQDSGPPSVERAQNGGLDAELDGSTSTSRHSDTSSRGGQDLDGENGMTRRAYKRTDSAERRMQRQKLFAVGGSPGQVPGSQRRRSSGGRGSPSSSGKLGDDDEFFRSQVDGEVFTS